MEVSVMSSPWELLDDAAEIIEDLTAIIGKENLSEELCERLQDFMEDYEDPETTVEFED